MKWIFGVGLFFLTCMAQAYELSQVSVGDSRRQGFIEHKKEEYLADRERFSGLSDYLKEKKEWEETRLAALEEHNKNKQDRADTRGPESYDEYAEQKLQDYEDYLESEMEYVQQKKALVHNYPSDLSEDEELDLMSHRPRFNYKNRVLYGAVPGKKKPKHALPPGPGGSSASDDLSGIGYNGGGSSVPGYIPPPIMPDNEFIEPPPPPPPAFEDGDFPPPPPPPPSFDEGDGF